MTYVMIQPRAHTGSRISFALFCGLESDTGSRVSLALFCGLESDVTAKCALQQPVTEGGLRQSRRSLEERLP